MSPEDSRSRRSLWKGLAVVVALVLAGLAIRYLIRGLKILINLSVENPIPAAIALAAIAALVVLAMAMRPLRPR